MAPRPAGQPRRRLLHLPRRRQAHGRAGQGRVAGGNGQHRGDRRSGAFQPLWRQQGRRHGHGPRARRRTGPLQDLGQFDPAGLDRDRNDRQCLRQREIRRQRHAAHSGAPLGHRRRFRPDCRLSGKPSHRLYDGARLRYRWRLYVVLVRRILGEVRMFKKLAACVIASVVFAAMPALAQQPAKPAPAAATPGAATPAGEDKYIGYYYPKPTTVENYTSAMQTIQGAERPQRVQFVTVVSQGTIQSAYRVPYSVFVKGDKAEKMII